MFMAYYQDMSQANIADIKNNLSKFIAMVEKGESVVICKRNIPIARIVPMEDTPPINQTQLGVGAGSVDILGDLTEPLIPEDSWQMLTDEPAA